MHHYDVVRCFSQNYEVFLISRVIWDYEVDQIVNHIYVETNGKRKVIEFCCPFAFILHALDKKAIPTVVLFLQFDWLVLCLMFNVFFGAYFPWQPLPNPKKSRNDSDANEGGNPKDNKLDPVTEDGGEDWMGGGEYDNDVNYTEQEAYDYDEQYGFEEY